MRSITEQLAHACRLGIESEKLRVRASGAENAADRAYIELRRRVLSGESTGCPIRNYTLAGPFTPSEEAFALAQLAEDHIAGAQSQFALAVYAVPQSGPEGYVPSRYRGTAYALGQFYGESLAFSRRNADHYCKLPVECLAYENHRGLLLFESIPSAFDLDWRKEFILGDGDVLAWMATNRPQIDMVPILSSFGKMTASSKAQG